MDTVPLLSYQRHVLIVTTADNHPGGELVMSLVDGNGSSGGWEWIDPINSPRYSFGTSLLETAK